MTACARIRRRALVLHLQRRIRTHFYHEFDGRAVSVAGGVEQRGLSVVVPVVDVGTPPQQETDYVVLTLPGSIIHRRLLVEVPLAHVTPSCDEELSTWDVSLSGGVEHRRLLVLVQSCRAEAAHLHQSTTQVVRVRVGVPLRRIRQQVAPVAVLLADVRSLLLEECDDLPDGPRQACKGQTEEHRLRRRMDDLFGSHGQGSGLLCLFLVDFELLFFDLAHRLLIALVRLLHRNETAHVDA
mmetsp:Transcript_15862/g.45192  ORF Transcript_15862/g.45192 Transcript_15862/m.45192 type:complete len:240 (+) Transcript_15862:1396-2115(+)